VNVPKIVVFLNKVDLVDDPAPFVAELEAVAPNVPVQLCAAKAKARAATPEEASLAALRPYLAPGRTVALVGSSAAWAYPSSARTTSRRISRACPRGTRSG
jgi:putative ribosome biogenesis GTPase RsgA